MPGDPAEEGAATAATALDPERLRSFVGLAVARVGPRAFEAVHGTFLALLVGARTGSAFLAAFALTAHRLLLWLILPVVGRLSDATRSRLGRRAPFLGGGLVVMGLATWSYTVIDGYWPLVVAILIARIANTCRQLTGAIAVPETFGRSRLLRAVVAIGIAGAIISVSVRVTVIATWDEADASTWSTSFRLAAAFMVLAGVLVLVLVRDVAAARELAAQPVRRERWRERVAEVMEVPNARLLLAGLFLTVAASGATGRLLPLFNREELGAGGAAQSTAILVAAGLGLVTSVPGAIWLLRRWSRVRLAVLGPLAGAAGAAAHLVVTDLWQSVAVGLVTGAFALAALLALLPLLLQLLPRSGGMGERVGLALGPVALVGVAATYAAALSVDHVGSYRVMWVYPLALSLVHAGLMTRLVLPPWAQRVDLRLRIRARRPGEARRSTGGLFGGDVEVDDVDPTVLFEVARRAFGNPYAPPRRRVPVEPERAAVARRVISVGTALTPAEVAEVAEDLDDHATLDDLGERTEGQAGVIERLAGAEWTLGTDRAWRLRAVDGATVTFELVPVDPDGVVEVRVEVDDRGRVAHIERSRRPTLAQQADAHARDLGYPVPTPVEMAVPPLWRRWDRSVATIGSIAQHLGPTLVRQLIGRPAPPAVIAARLRRAFDRLGGGYLKLGQVIASSPSLVGEDVAQELRATLDEGPVLPIRQVRAVIADELGRPVDEVFASIDPEPLGRASIAVVHRATTTGGRPVAIKVIRPGVESSMATDLALMGPLLRATSAAGGGRLTGPLMAVLEGFRRQVAEELDLDNERRAMHHHRALLAQMDLPGVVIPEPVDALSSRRVLTMELLDGVPVDDLAAVDALGLDAAGLVEQVVKAWFTAAIRSGTFHGDVHAGNLMLLRDGRVGVIDWGIVGRLDPGTHGFFRDLLAGALGDESAWDRIGDHVLDLLGPGHDEHGIDREDLLAVLRPQLEAILTRPFGEVSLGALLSDAQRTAAAQRTRRGARRALRGPAPPFNRGVFLLGKQLLYFERYGRLHLGELSLLGDRAFFERLISAAPSPPDP